jgi:hypothetical protein
MQCWGGGGRVKGVGFRVPTLSPISLHRQALPAIGKTERKIRKMDEPAVISEEGERGLKPIKSLPIHCITTTRV